MHICTHCVWCTSVNHLVGSVAAGLAKFAIFAKIGESVAPRWLLLVCLWVCWSILCDAKVFHWLRARNRWHWWKLLGGVVHFVAAHTFILIWLVAVAGELTTRLLVSFFFFFHLDTATATAFMGEPGVVKHLSCRQPESWVLDEACLEKPQTDARVVRPDVGVVWFIL